MRHHLSLIEAVFEYVSFHVLCNNLPLSFLSSCAILYSESTMQ